MDPDSTTPASRGNIPVPQRGGTLPSPTNHTHREAAANIVRSELNAIYAGSTNIDTPHTTPIAQPVQDPAITNKASAGKAIADEAAKVDADSAYGKTHTTPELRQHDSWKNYHSAWQDYYQKYYEHYYVNAVKQNFTQPTAHTPKPTTTTAPDDDGELTRDEALYELRQNIISQASESAKKVRKSRHFIPIAAAFAVVMVFALLQYNQVLIANVKAYVSPGTIAPQNIIIDPSAEVPVDPETKMIIPKINVDAPIVMNVGPSNDEQLKAMADGIAHVRYPGASSEPGQVGNAVFSAHSSSDWTDSGAYKFIFVQLERITVDDVVYINYNSKRYSYKVFDTKIVDPKDIGALRYTGSDPIITLITCTPLGTAEKRLLIFAKQVSPDPSGATKPKPSEKEETVAPAEFTGTSPTSIERFFGNLFGSR